MYDDLTSLDRSGRARGNPGKSPKIKFVHETGVRFLDTGSLPLTHPLHQRLVVQSLMWMSCSGALPSVSRP